MPLDLTETERAMLARAEGAAAGTALRIVVETAAMLGAKRLIEIASVHVDGCLYHGDSGTLFVEKLVEDRGAVRVPTTLNVGALDLACGAPVRLAPHEKEMARRMMQAYQRLGCTPSFTCAPYQAGHRPARGQDVAWGESNAVVFCNSVLGARTNRYGDYLDIAAALCGRAPQVGLHLPENRRAALAVDLSALPARLMEEDVFYPILGSWLGREVGSAVPCLTGLPADVATEDRLKALGAAAASSGAVGLFHIAGVTPEASTLEEATQGTPPERTIHLSAAMLDAARRKLSTRDLAPDAPIQAVALGSPHFSLAECRSFLALAKGRHARIPVYICTGRHVVARLEELGLRSELEACGVTIVADTCIVVTPMLPDGHGTLITNSGKFAHYTLPNTGWDAVYGSLGDCVETAVTGRFSRDDSLWL